MKKRCYDSRHRVHQFSDGAFEEITSVTSETEILEEGDAASAARNNVVNLHRVA